MREPKKRTIYNNYDLWDDYAEEAREYLIDAGCTEDELTDNNTWSEIYSQDEAVWACEHDSLRDFFSKGNSWILMGTTERWNGKFRGGTVFSDFDDMLSKAMKDCDYLNIYDENGHMYLKCSHHDGTNLYEIKKMTDKGIEYFDRWNYGTDNRTLQQCHEQIWKRYSVLPNYANKMFGCKRYEWV